MAKSSKKKKEKNADFVKPKLKLGKGKQIAANAVNTSFKARSIALPQQSITVSKDEAVPTTKRKLSLDDLVAHLKHYSANVRKDALLGLRELLDDNSSLVETHLSTIINSCVRLIGDEDALVRKGLLTFLTWLLSRLPAEHIIPHSQALLLFTASAQTHIFAEVRLDAVRILDLLLDVIPDQVVAGCMTEPGQGSGASHGRKVLDGYMSLLNASVRFANDGPQASTSASVMLSPASKALVVNSLSKFLARVTTDVTVTNPIAESHSSAMPLWYFAPSFADRRCFDLYSDIFKAGPSKSIMTPNCSSDREMPDDDFVGSFPMAAQLFDSNLECGIPDLTQLVEEVRNAAISSDSSYDQDTDSSSFLISSLCRALNPVLVSTFLDCAPSVFMPARTAPEAEVQLVLSVLEIARSLYGALLRKGMHDQQQVSAREELRGFLNHLSLYFPFGENRMVAESLKNGQAMQIMSLIYCELFSLLFAGTQDNSISEQSEGYAGGKKRKQSMKKEKPVKRQKYGAGASSLTGSAGLNKQASHVRSYIIRSLRGEVQSAAQPMGQTLTTSTYDGLLPTIWWMLNRDMSEDTGEIQESEVFHVVIEHAIRVGSTSALKKSVTEFVARLVLLRDDRYYRGTFEIDRCSPASLKMLREWVMHLPKVLWELSGKQHSAVELILRFFLRLLQRRSAWLLDPATRIGLAARLIPFFIMQHPTKGRIPGPFLKLSSGSSRGSPEMALNVKANGDASHSLQILALDVVWVLLASAPSPLLQGQRDHRAESVKSNETNGDTEYAGLRSAVLAVAAIAGPYEQAYWMNLSPGASVVAQSDALHMSC